MERRGSGLGRRSSPHDHRANEHYQARVTRVIASCGESARALFFALHAAEHTVEFHADCSTVTGLRDALSVRVALTAIEGAEPKIRLDAIGLAVETGDANMLATPAPASDTLAIRFPRDADVRIVYTLTLGADKPVAAATAFERSIAPVRHGAAGAKLVAGRGIARAHSGRQITVALRVVGAMSIGAAYAGIDAPSLAAAVGTYGTAFPRFATPFVRIRTAQFFAITSAVAAGAIAALTVVRPAATRVAAIRPAIGKSLWTETRSIDWDLDTRTTHWFRIRLGGPPGRLGTAHGRDFCKGRRTAESEQPLEHSPAAASGAERFGQQVESTIVHDTSRSCCWCAHSLVTFTPPIDDYLRIISYRRFACLAHCAMAVASRGAIGSICGMAATGLACAVRRCPALLVEHAPISYYS